MGFEIDFSAIHHYCRYQSSSFLVINKRIFLRLWNVHAYISLYYIIHLMLMQVNSEQKSLDQLERLLFKWNCSNVSPSLAYTYNIDNNQTHSDAEDCRFPFQQITVTDAQTRYTKCKWKHSICSMFIVHWEFHSKRMQVIQWMMITLAYRSGCTNGFLNSRILCTLHLFDKYLFQYCEWTCIVGIPYSVYAICIFEWRWLHYCSLQLYLISPPPFPSASIWTKFFPLYHYHLPLLSWEWIGLQIQQISTETRILFNFAHFQRIYFHIQHSNRIY